MKWFKHDSNAHRDAKIKKLKNKYGITGYGIYWYCIEMIAESVEKNNVSFELEYDAELIAVEWGLDQLKVQEMMLFMVDINLFENENGVITCFKLAKRLDDTNARNPEVKGILTKYFGKSPTVSVDSPTVSEQIRLDKIRLDKIRLEESKAILVTSNDDDAPPPKKIIIPFKKIISLYHEMLPTLPRMEKLTKAREGYIRQRSLEDLQELEDWRNFFDYISQSDFLMGRVASNSERPPFRADLEWVTKPANYAKIYEEKYHGI